MKMRFKIWNWSIEKYPKEMSKCLPGEKKYWYALSGLSDQYMQGRFVTTSAIIRLDFETGIVETQNSIYELQSEVAEFPLKPKRSMFYLSGVPCLTPENEQE